MWPHILFISLSDVLKSAYPEYYVLEKLREDSFDLERMILYGVAMDGNRLWYAQERVGYGTV